MPRDLLADISQAPGQQPRDLLRDQPAPVPTSTSPGFLSQFALAPVAVGAGMLGVGEKGGQAFKQLIDTLTNKILGTHLQAPPSDVFGAAGRRISPAMERLGETTGYGLTLGAGGPSPEAGLIPRMAGSGALMAATQPGGLMARGIAGTLGAAVPATETMAKGFLPSLTTGRLAKNIEKVFAQQKGIAKNLYNKAFAGTENITPQISPASYRGLDEVSQTSLDAKKALKTYNNNQTLEGMHTLKSDLNKIASKFSDKSIKAGLSGTDQNTLSLLRGGIDPADSGIIGSLDKDLETQFRDISPEKSNQYQTAQAHYKQNVVPFRNFKSIRDLLTPGLRKQGPLLRKHLLEESDPAAHLREMLGLTRPGLKVAQAIPGMVGRSIKIGAPAGVGGFGAYELMRHLFGE